MRHTRLYRDGVLEAKDFPAAQISDYLQEPGTVVWLDLCEPDQADLASAFHGLAAWFAVGWDSRQGVAAGGVRCGGGARVGGLERLARHDHR
jgi:hypothetical protein